MTKPPHTDTPDPAVLEQIEALPLITGRPLIISDADEVLIQFLAGLERYLETRDLWLDLQSFALTGNIRHVGTNEPFAAANMPALLEDFFAAQAEKLDIVPGAADSLATLSERAQIVVLTNVPFAAREARAASLAANGIDYPVIANKGLKGAAVRHLAARVDAPVIFLDDIPHNITSVAKAHAPARLIHFIADTRLARLIPPCSDSHFHTSEWPAAQGFIEQQLSDAGF